MNHHFHIVVIFIFALVWMSPVRAQERNSADSRAQQLQALVDDAVRQTLEKFAGKQLKPDQLAVTVVDLGDPRRASRASYRGDAQMCPASVVKLFYLVAVHRWLEDGKLSDTEELRRAMHDMIVESYNEPTHYIVDLLTGTTSGPELAPSALKDWADKRRDSRLAG